MIGLETIAVSIQPLDEEYALGLISFTFIVSNLIIPSGSYLPIGRRVFVQEADVLISRTVKTTGLLNPLLNNSTFHQQSCAPWVVVEADHASIDPFFQEVSKYVFMIVAC